MVVDEEDQMQRETDQQWKDEWHRATEQRGKHQRSRGEEQRMETPEGDP
jgi:hypothetical protein